ncbi:MAG: hypothetical protein NWF00_05565 [Candidatus Bathyarchaeota archaeon]|nr:hypothetical protein [Candidatus Bathyarchaeota archaeon]
MPLLQMLGLVFVFGTCIHFLWKLFYVFLGFDEFCEQSLNASLFSSSLIKQVQSLGELFGKSQSHEEIFSTLKQQKYLQRYRLEGLFTLVSFCFAKSNMKPSEMLKWLCFCP